MQTKKAKIKTRVATERLKQRGARALRLRQRPLLDLFLMALAELYPHDRLAPGVVLAYLPKEQKFYGSVKRYESSTNCEVLYAKRGDSMLEVIQELAQGWFDSNKASREFAIAVRRR